MDSRSLACSVANGATGRRKVLVSGALALSVARLEPLKPP